MTGAPDVLVVVPAGGTAHRLGGGDKTALVVGGRTVLRRLLADLTAWPTVVVADPPPAAARADVPHARWCREDPRGAGPLAALAAGLATAPGARVLVAVAGDQPFAGRAVPALLAALDGAPEADAALAAGPDGRVQPLLGAYRTAAVGAVLRGPVADRPVRALWAHLRIVTVDLPAVHVLDVDDAADLARARAAARREDGPGARS
ncbi:NTP transferase domain-containing protein [Cellulomonas shaoxiangyii]|uniref:Molybdenum cofactor guanylyltransferase n=1 Tax=Cellulomonas shaoxiangyii TaxID=2566013 RepID=A0A4P7SHQ1_9CELL|nr:NTP transferase domain-containing protein [Cellulomonas shaoxiangyii]QCB93749.1 molybdenum cofactor guanylyltransferase [Cellulomonas shaoxiangyii]TGY81645.1 molybdenum cofactor guanylyltransferase [Cellulomonas shaoxiangyii]